MDVMPVTLTLYLRNGIGGKVDADQLVGGHLNSKRAAQRGSAGQALSLDRPVETAEVQHPSALDSA